MGYLNPLLRLPAARALLGLDKSQKAALAALMMDLRRAANDEAERAWTRRKGPMACYWRAVSTYARHVAHVLGRGGSAHPHAEDGTEVARLQRELDVARRQVAMLVEAASAAIPPAAHPPDPSPEGWGLQLRALAAPELAAGSQFGALSDPGCGLGGRHN